MNKNLMAKFYKVFKPNGEIKRNDIVSILGNAEDKPQKEVKVIDVQFQPFSMLYHDKARKLRECLEGEDVFVNVPFVSLVEVLEKLNEKISSGKLGQKEMYLEEDMNELCIIFQDQKPIYWKLSDNDGEVPLHRQSKEKQDQIYEVLK